MRILFDQGTPAPLRKFLPGHDVKTASEQAWSNLENGDLLNAAEMSFDLLITTDKNLPYQQNIKGRRIAILVLPTTSWPKLRKHTYQIAAAVGMMSAGEYHEMTFDP
jgi:hypothetical protein